MSGPGQERAGRPHVRMTTRAAHLANPASSTQARLQQSPKLCRQQEAVFQRSAWGSANAITDSVRTGHLQPDQQLAISTHRATINRRRRAVQCWTAPADHVNSAARAARPPSERARSWQGNGSHELCRQPEAASMPRSTLARPRRGPTQSRSWTRTERARPTNRRTLSTREATVDPLR
jgi:1,2-phenylacetyl-CoA epoxidase PaaB subunit